jgi:hypothetical protein
MFHDSVGNAPAKENSLAVPLGCASFEYGSLGAASGMESEIGVIERFAIMESDIIANLEAETVAVIVTSRYAFE